MILGWPTDFWKVINTALGGDLTPFLTSSPLGIGITGEVTLHAEGEEQCHALEREDAVQRQRTLQRRQHLLTPPINLTSRLKQIS